MTAAPAAPPSPSPQRIAAWCALSQLFLDTGHGEQDIAAIARQLRATGFDAAALSRILEREVAPVCGPNLAALPGGVWSGFDPAWLARAITQRLDADAAACPGWRIGAALCRWRERRWAALVRDDWLRVRRLLDASR